jgi:CO/xanthine dehydrogenase FAD-binding subunit
LDAAASENYNHRSLRRIVHASKAEDILRGQEVIDAKLKEMGEVAAAEVDPMDDNRGSSEYKREMVNARVCRAAKEALERC